MIELTEEQVHGLINTLEKCRDGGGELSVMISLMFLRGLLEGDTHETADL